MNRSTSRIEFWNEKKRHQPSEKFARALRCMEYDVVIQAMLAWSSLLACRETSLLTGTYAGNTFISLCFLLPRILFISFETNRLSYERLIKHQKILSNSLNLYSMCIPYASVSAVFLLLCLYFLFAKYIIVFHFVYIIRPNFHFNRRFYF